MAAKASGGPAPKGGEPYQVYRRLRGTRSSLHTRRRSSRRGSKQFRAKRVEVAKELDIAAARADRKAIVGANMKLTDSEAAAFWPLNDAYEARMDKLDDRHAAEIKAYAEHYQTLTDEDAKNKLDEVIAIGQARLDVQTQYVPKVRSAILSIKTTRFFQIDNKLRAMIQCDIARIVPLARPGKITAEE
jgi:septum formation topological specificity factor MinE